VRAFSHVDNDLPAHLRYAARMSRRELLMMRLVMVVMGQ
jgi:hypothetical protein